MKTQTIRMLLSVFLLLSLSPCLLSCGTEHDNLLYSTESDGRTICVRGSGTRAGQVVVKEGETVLWSESVKTDKKVGNLYGTYGLYLDDFNFDGATDLLLATAVEGECVSSVCWLWNSEKKTYVRDATLSGLLNVRADPELQAVFAFRHTETVDEEDAAAQPFTTDSATKYLWQDGALIPSIRLDLTYYVDSRIYCYSAVYYNEVTHGFDPPDTERWITPEQFAQTDFGFLYYFR